jgi:hypothetical protein
MENQSGIEYYEELPSGYVKLPQYKEIFEKVDTLTTENAKVREGLKLILFNPQTNQYYHRYLYSGSNREDLLRYFKDGNLYISQSDIIWSNQLTLL